MDDIKKNLVVVGDPTCGKTSLLTVFSRSEFPQDYLPTLFDNDTVVEIEVNIDEKCVTLGPCMRFKPCARERKVTVELRLWDTAGQEELDRFRRISYPDADVILICFSIDDSVSFENVMEKWVPEARHFCPNVPLLLIGNKRDLRSDRATSRRLSKIKQEVITHEKIDKISKQIKPYVYLECSAKNNDGVKDVFEAAARAALRIKKGPSQCRLYPV